MSGETIAPGGPPRYFGKYRATVADAVDPLRLGRIRVVVPDVSGAAPSTWALPCLPLAGVHSGIFALPQVGAAVWVEFERGDPDLPVWVGGFWATPADVPPVAPSTPGLQTIVLRTALGNGLTISDEPGPAGGIRIETPGGAIISVSDEGVLISNGKGAVISALGPTVDVNVGALTVT